MKKPPKGAVFETKIMKRCDFLESALHRLNDDVGSYFEMLEEFNKKSNRKVGFWTSLRIIMPIIEAIAHVTKETPQEFMLNHLDIQVPYLTWDLFRHSLIHGDYMHHATYNDKTVNWGVALIGVGHVIEKEHIGIDTIYLYKSLKKYLEEEIRKNDQALIEVEIGVIYQNPKPQIVEDFRKL